MALQGEGRGGGSGVGGQHSRRDLDGALGPGRQGGDVTGAGVSEIVCHFMLTYVLRNFLSGSWWVSKHPVLLAAAV